MHNEPLAFRMRPLTLDEVVGHQDFIGPNTALYKMIHNGHVPSMLLYGEPGIGKTSIANAIAGGSKLPSLPLMPHELVKRMLRILYKKLESQEKSCCF